MSKKAWLNLFIPSWFYFGLHTGLNHVNQHLSLFSTEPWFKTAWEDKHVCQRAPLDVFQHKWLYLLLTGRILLARWVTQEEGEWVFHWKDKNMEQKTDGHADRLMKHFWLTKQIYGADLHTDGSKWDWGTKWQVSSLKRSLGWVSFQVKLKTVCCCKCFRNLKECQHHGLPADLSWWLMWCISTFDACVGFICACVGVLSTALWVIDPAEGTHNMGLFLFHARLFYIQEQYIMLKCMLTEPLDNTTCLLFLLMIIT